MAGKICRFAGGKTAKRLGLLLSLILYTAIGAMIFHFLEYDSDIEQINHVKTVLQSAKRIYLDGISLLCSTSPHNNSKINDQFAKLTQVYEAEVEASLSQGFSPQLLQTDEIPARWGYMQCLFFAATVLTTIGYGNLAPSTSSGKTFCMLFALIGIPFTLTVVANVGEALVWIIPARLSNKMCQGITKQAKCQTAFRVIWTVFLLISFMIFGSIVFSLMEHWTFLDSFYFCFITATTIGFGDLVPENKLPCAIFILGGLAITSAVIELVRRQYAASWERMKNLSSRLNELSAPLADTMKKMLEMGGGQFDVDEKLIKEWQQLTSLLKDGTEAENDPWQQLLNIVEGKKHIKIFIYETSL